MVVSFDFDETLTMPTWNSKYGLLEPSSIPNQAAIEKLLEHHQQGEEIAIVTTRWRDEEILTFVEKHQLPISKIVCTEGELKHTQLCQLHCKLHYDDSEVEAIANQKAGIATVLIGFEFSEAENKVVCKFGSSK